MTQTDRIDGLQASVAIKAPCRVATTAPITLAGLQTIDGIALAVDDRVLVKDQTDAKENGIYVAATTPWLRAKDFNGARDVVQGTILAVASGTTHGGEFFKVTAGAIAFGTTSITFESVGGTFIPPVPINEGGTGATTADGALTSLGGTTVGRDLFKATDAAAARSAMGAEAADADILKADTPDILTAGFAATPYDAGTKSSGTFTPDESDGNLQYYVNGGAHTLAPPSNNCTLIIQMTNNVSAGALTTSGFTKVTGSTLSTTDGDDFLFFITKINGFSFLNKVALQ